MSWQGRYGSPLGKVLEAFVLRGRRIIEHSLIRDHRDLMQKLATESITIHVTDDRSREEASYVVEQDFPDEEIVGNRSPHVYDRFSKCELVYFHKVLDALEMVPPQSSLTS